MLNIRANEAQCIFCQRGTLIPQQISVIPQKKKIDGEKMHENVLMMLPLVLARLRLKAQIMIEALYMTFRTFSFWGFWSGIQLLLWCFSLNRSWQFFFFLILLLWIVMTPGLWPPDLCQVIQRQRRRSSKSLIHERRALRCLARV